MGFGHRLADVAQGALRSIGNPRMKAEQSPRESWMSHLTAGLRNLLAFDRLFCACTSALAAASLHCMYLGLPIVEDSI